MWTATGAASPRESLCLRPLSVSAPVIGTTTFTTRTASGSPTDFHETILPHKKVTSQKAEFLNGKNRRKTNNTATRSSFWLGGGSYLLGRGMRKIGTSTKTLQTAPGCGKINSSKGWRRQPDGKIVSTRPPVRCPRCERFLLTILPETKAVNLPLYCDRCKQHTLIANIEPSGP